MSVTLASFLNQNIRYFEPVLSTTTGFFKFFIASCTSKMQQQPNVVAKYIYWTSATVISIASIVAYGMFFKNKKLQAMKALPDYKFASAWNRTKLVLGLLQVVIHPCLIYLRVTNGENAKKYFAISYFDNALLQNNGQSFFGALFTCNIMISLFSVGSLFYIWSAFQRKTCIPIINRRMEIFSLSLWMYVFAYRMYYSEQTLYDSWETVQYRSQI